MANKKEKSIAVLIPCYNEELTVGKTVGDFKKELPKAKIYVYNNNSTDKTVEIAEKAGAIVVNEYQQGKGNVGKPDVAKKSRGEQFFFVNNRFIRSPYLHNALCDACEVFCYPLIPNNLT